MVKGQIPESNTKKGIWGIKKNPRVKDLTFMTEGINNQYR
jgi:hypothetical protein